MPALHNLGKSSEAPEPAAYRTKLLCEEFAALQVEAEPDEYLSIGLVLFKLPRTGSTLLTTMATKDLRIKIIEEPPVLTQFFLALDNEEGLQREPEQAVRILRNLMRLLALRTASGQESSFFNLGSLCKPTPRVVTILKRAAPGCSVVYQHRKASEVCASMLIKPPKYIADKHATREEQAVAIVQHVVSSVRAARESAGQLSAIVYYKDVLEMNAIARLRRDWCSLTTLEPSEEKNVMEQARLCLSVHSKTGVPFSAAVERKAHRELPGDLNVILQRDGPDVASFVFD